MSFCPHARIMNRYERLLFGNVEFQESQEYSEFQFKLLAVSMFFGALFTALFLIGAYTGANPLSGPHLTSMTVFTTVALLLWIVLRGHAERFSAVAWTYLLICLCEYASALAFVPEDELRILWFYINIPGVYILLGQRVGLAVALLSMFYIGMINAHLSRPYSPNALATAQVSLAYFTLFFHVYGARSISYFVRMRASNQRLHEMATHDMLTGVMNARAYYGQCDALIRVAEREERGFSVLFVDLDHFKSINDTHGHDAGDIVLRTVAQCLKQGLRASDVLGRIGGEEFSVFLPNTDMTGARSLAESLRQSIEALMPDTGKQRLRITASIGVAGSQPDINSMREIQQRADEAMYHAKKAGRNRVSCFEGMAVN